MQKILSLLSLCIDHIQNLILIALNC